MDTDGYVVIHDVLSPNEIVTARDLFNKWKLSGIHVENNGIIKNNSGHQEHAWYIRTRPAVQNIFKNLLNTDDLIVSFDGCCYMDKDSKYEGVWTHVDQSTENLNFRCYQGLVSLTNNVEKTIVLYKGTHLLYEDYVNKYNKKVKCNFHFIENDYLKTCTKSVIKVNAGSMVVWDSRTFHQNQCGINNEDRMVQYISYMPKDHPDNTLENKQKRLYAFEERITSTHWSAPIRYINPSYKSSYIGNLDPYIKDIMNIL